MDWNSKIFSEFEWSGKISNLNEKKKVAQSIANKVRNGEVVGVGSGSTAYLAIMAISDRIKKENLIIKVIPTSIEVTLACASLNIPTTTLFDMRPDWYFDGADEVDPNNNLIKGRGGAMFKEKLLMASSPKTYIIVDSSKFVKKLGEQFPIPVEVFPMSVHYVQERLFQIGATKAKIRLAVNKDGPVITENGNLILDVEMEEIKKTTEKDIKEISGVIESGLFYNYNVEIITPENC